MTGRGHSRRRAFAIAACVLWLLGIEVLPGVHLAHHDHHHTHAADGSILQLEDHDHDALADAHDQRRHVDADGQLAIDHPIESGHQAGGVAHHALALHQPSPPLLAPLPVVRGESRVVLAVADLRFTRTMARPAARGPPATS